MTEDDLMRMIDAEAARSRAADRRHLEVLADQMAEGLDSWCAARRRLTRTACALLLLAVPATYAAALPQRQLPPVLCNEADGTDAVLACANEILLAS